MRTVAFPVALTVLLVAGCATDEPETAAPPPVTPSASSGPAAATPSAAASPGSAATTARAVYWLGSTKDPRGPRLYREFVRRDATADPVRDALEVMLGSEPNDPDYTSLWADGTTVRGIRRDGSTAVVDLSAEARESGGGSAFEAMSLQQLVHTVTAADTSVRDVRLLVEGQPVESLWGSADASRPISRAPAAGTLGPVWIDLQEGAELSGEFGGTATVFEATVSWELRQDGRVVQEGFSTATEGAPGRGEWKGTADVPPGDYVLWAYESSAQDGSITWLDTKSVTVTE